MWLGLLDEENQMDPPPFWRVETCRNQSFLQIFVYFALTKPIVEFLKVSSGEQWPKLKKRWPVCTSKKTQASFGKCPCTVHVLRCIASTFGGWLKQLLQRRLRGARTAGCCVGGVVHLPVGGATAWCFYFGPLDWSFWISFPLSSLSLSTVLLHFLGMS
jgi:hypothetical protein